MNAISLKAFVPLLSLLMAPLSFAQAVDSSRDVLFTIGGEGTFAPRSYDQTLTITNPALGGSGKSSGDSDVALRIGAVPSMIVLPSAPVGLLVSASVGFDYSSEDTIDSGDISADESTGAYVNFLVGPSIKVGQYVRLSMLGAFGGSAGSTSHTVKYTDGSSLNGDGTYSGFEYGFRFQANYTIRRAYIAGFVGYLHRTVSEDGTGNFDAGQGNVWIYNGQRLAPMTYTADLTISGPLFGIGGGYNF
jgi:hypothetical protein